MSTCRGCGEPQIDVGHVCGANERIGLARKAWNARGEGQHPDLEDLLILSATDLFAAVDERDALRQRIAELERESNEYWQVAGNHIDANEKLHRENAELRKRVTELELELRDMEDAWRVFYNT